MPIIKIVNATTGEEIEREMNLEELAQWEADVNAAKAEQEAKTKAAKARAAILDKIGLTEEEVKLLLS